MSSTEMWKIFSIAHMDGRIIEVWSFFHCTEIVPQTEMCKAKESMKILKKLTCGSKFHIGTHS